MKNIENKENKIERQEKEVFRKIDVKIKEPDGMHEFGYIFDEQNVGLIVAYNRAILELCKNKLGIFHQTGIKNNPGYHYWESLNGSAGESFNQLLPQIHELAEKEYNGLSMEEIKFCQENNSL